MGYSKGIWRSGEDDQAALLGFKCANSHLRKASNYLLVELGVKQDCLVFGLLFLLVFEWIMKKVTSERVTGVKWVDGETLEDVDFVDDLALESDVKYAQEKMKVKAL